MTLPHPPVSGTGTAAAGAAIAGALALLLGLLLVGCDTATDPVLATFAGGEVTQSEVDAYLAVAGRRDRRREPRQVVLQVAVTETLARAAEARGLDEDPAISRRLLRIEDAPWLSTLEAKSWADSEPTEEAISDYLEENRWRLDKPRKVRLWNIFKRAPSDAPSREREEVRRRMQALRERLLAGEDFGELAKVESQAVNRYRGGKMGPIPPGQLAEEVEAVAFALAEGETSPVIDVGEGFVILRNAGFVPATTMTEEEAVERIRSAMRRWNHEAAWEALRAELFESATVAVYEDAIAEARPETVIGIVSGDSITYGEIDDLARSQGVGAQPERLTDARIRAVFLAQTFDRLAAERSRRLGLAPSPEASARARWRGLTLLAGEELERRALEEPVEVGDGEARAFFDSNPSLFEVPAQALVSLIQLRLDGAGNEQLRAQTQLARRTLERIRGGEISFAEAARELSQHPSAASGGDVGWKPRRWAASLGPNVLHVFDRLEAGELSDVVRQDHLWILHLRKVRDARSLTFEEGLQRARAGVVQQRYRERLRALHEAATARVEATLEIRALPELPALPDRRRPARAASQRAR